MRFGYGFVRVSMFLVSMLFVIVLFVRHSLGQIDHRQHYENESLNEGDKDSEHYREDWNEPGRKVQKRPGDLVIGEHIDEQAKR